MPTRSQQATVDQPRFPNHWSTNPSSLSRALKAFQNRTIDLRATEPVRSFFRRYEPPSTGATPEHSRSTSPLTEPSRATSADEAIYNRPIGPEMAQGFTEAQLAELRAMIAEFRTAAPTGPPGPTGPRGEPGPSGVGSERFNADDVGYFDPFYEGKSVDTAPAIEHTGKSTFFRDIHVFIDRVKDMARAKGDDLLKQNLQVCLRGGALAWYTTELTENDKRLVSYGIEEWYRLLLSRWKQPRSQGMSVLLREKYSMQDASRHREPREYAQTIMRAAQNADMGVMKDHILLIWNGLDTEFQRDIPEPDANSDYNRFLESLDKRKYQWWEHASRHSRQPAHAFQSQKRQEPRGGYTQSRQPQPIYQRQYQPNAYQTYQNSQQSPRPWKPSTYGNNQAYQAYQGNQGNQGNAHVSLPAPPTKLQITAPPAQAGNVSGSRPDRPYPNISQGRQPFRPSNGNYQNQNQGNQHRNQSRYPVKPQRAYQASVEEGETDPDYPFAEGFGGASQEETPEEGFYSHEEDDQAIEGIDDYVEQYFSKALPSADYQCEICGHKTTSRNKLFLHLREDCWKSKKPSAGPSSTDTQVVTTKLAVDALSSDTRKPNTASDPLIVPSVSEPVPGTGFAFRNYHYAVTHISWKPTDMKKETCADAGCTMTMADRTFVPANTEMRKMATKIPIRGLGSKIHHSDEYAVLTFYMEGVLPDGTRAFAEITREVHIVDDLKAGMLIGSDILTPERMVIDFATQSIKIGSCRDMAVPMDSRARSEPVRRAVKSSARLTLAPRTTQQVPVLYACLDKLPEDRDFLFEPQCSLQLGQAGGVYAHVVDASFQAVQVRNDTDLPVVIPRKTRLGTLGEYDQDGCFPIEAYHSDLAATGWRNWKTKLARDVMTIASAMTAVAAPIPMPSDHQVELRKPTAGANSDLIVIDPSLENVLPNGVTVYGKPEAAEPLARLLDEHQDLFVDQGQTVDIPEEEWMPIPIKPDAVTKPAKVYPVGQKDKQVIDDTFDKLHAQGKMTWSKQPTPYSYPVFVVWKDTPNGRKGRVVVDIRELNKIAETDTYPLPLQSEIISLLLGYAYLSTIDAVGWFHQFLVARSDRFKFTLVTHRGQEESAVALMGYKGSPPYVQRQTDAMLRPFKDFAKAFVDDIIIFSRTLRDHLSHLRQIFELFRSKRVSLSPTKSFIGYPSVTLLGQRVDGLGMSTSQEKIQAITSLRFPETLRDLEIFLGLTGWLRSSIPRYAQLANPLQERKTILTKGLGAGAKGPSRKRSATKVLFYEPTEPELEAFHKLQEAFSSPTFLAHYDVSRPLFVDLDASKSFGFAAIIYHIKQDRVPTAKDRIARTDVQPIMFLSRCLNAAERNYWPTELEVAGIVWVVKKVRHMIESSQHSTIIYTDHSAAIPISKQTSLNTSSTDKLNLRLVRASQYLSSFNLELRHKAGRSNTVPDALSRLPQASTADPDTSEKEGVLDALLEHVEAYHSIASSEPIPVYHSTLVEMSDDFKHRLKQAYLADPHWAKLHEMLKASAEAPTTEASVPGIPFVRKEELMYHEGAEGRLRLVIPQSMEQELFEQAHDLSSHGGYHKCHDRLAHTVYIRHLSRNLRGYIAHCPACQLNQTKRHKPYGSLVPLDTPAIPFHTIAMDFIVGLPITSAGMNCLLTLTCKFTKRVLLVPGQDTWSAPQWAEVVLRTLLQHDWGVPRSTISDRDQRFMSDFWKEIFKILNVKFLTSTAYHPQTDGQSERTNQTVEIALRFYLTAHPDAEWDQILPYIQSIINNSPNATTGMAPNELCYGFKVADPTSLLLAAEPPVSEEAFHQLRLAKREEADDAMAFASISMKARYDARHLPLNLKKGDSVFLKLHHGYSIPGLSSRKLSQQRVGPFKILEKVGHQAYRLELPPVMRIHPVISIAQLEPAATNDRYGRKINEEPPPVRNEADLEEDEYEVERVIGKRPSGNKTQYLLKWYRYGNEHNVWFDEEDLPDARDLIQEYEDRQVAKAQGMMARQAPKATRKALMPTTPIATQEATPPKRGRGRPKKAA